MVADAIIEREPGGFTLAKIFDLTGLVLLLAIAFDAIGSIVSAVTLPEIGGPNGIINSDVATYDRLTTGAGWAAGALDGILLLLAVAVVVLPRLFIEAEMEPDWPARARRLVIAAGAVAAVCVTANLVTIFTTLAHPGLPSNFVSGSQQARVVGEAAGGLVLEILAAVLAWGARPHWPAAAEPVPPESSRPYGAEPGV
jgi:hypothetical protein